MFIHGRAMSVPELVSVACETETQNEQSEIMKKSKSLQKSIEGSRFPAL